MDKNETYVYVFLDNRKPGHWEFEGIHFDHQPFYVGIGRKLRMFEHLQKRNLKKHNIKNVIIKKIMSQCEENPIFYKIFENLSNDQAKLKEKEIISHFGRINLKTGILSNLTDGGEGDLNLSQESIKKRRDAKIGGKNPMSKVVEQYDFDMNLINTWDSLSDAARHLNVSNTVLIGSSCKNPNRTAYGFKWRFTGETRHKKKEKPYEYRAGSKIYQYSKEGNFIRSYISWHEATDITGTPLNSIANNLQQKNKYPCKNGFQWFREYQGEKVIPVNKKGKDIYQYSIEGEYIKCYPGIQIAEKVLGIRRISKNAYGKSSHAGGYRWFFSFQGDKIEPFVKKSKKKLIT